MRRDVLLAIHPQRTAEAFRRRWNGTNHRSSTRYPMQRFCPSQKMRPYVLSVLGQGATLTSPPLTLLEGWAPPWNFLRPPHNTAPFCPGARKRQICFPGPENSFVAWTLTKPPIRGKPNRAKLAPRLGLEFLYRDKSEPRVARIVGTRQRQACPCERLLCRPQIIQRDESDWGRDSSNHP